MPPGSVLFCIACSPFRLLGTSRCVGVCPVPLVCFFVSWVLPGALVFSYAFLGFGPVTFVSEFLGFFPVLACLSVFLGWFPGFNFVGLRRLGLPGLVLRRLGLPGFLQSKGE